MNIVDYYKPLILLSKQKKIPIEIIRNIFDSYLKKDIILSIQIDAICNKLDRLYNNLLYNKINNKRGFGDSLSIHLCDIPYSCHDITKYTNIVTNIININNYNLYFSHYCCNNNGIVYTFNNPLNQNHHFLLS